MTTFKIITDYDDFLRQHDSWNELVFASEVDHVFMRHEWFACWIRSYRAQERISIVTGWRDGQLISIAPIQYSKFKIKNFQINCISFLSSSISPRCNLIVSNIDEIEGIVLKTLSLSNWNLLTLNNLEEGLNTTKVFLNCLRCENRNPFRVEEGRRSPYLYVPSSWEEYCKSVSRNRRKYLKSNSQNRLKKASEYSIELIDENSDSNGIFSIIEKISSKSWKNDVGSSISKDERRKSFYRTFTNDGLKKGWVHVWLLKIEGNYVAFEYYLRSRKTYAAIRSDYDKNFAYYHPGENLKIAVLKHMCDDETLDEFDFGGNAAPYKLNWTKKIRKHVNLLIGNRTLLGRSILFSKNYIRPLINVLKS